MTPVTVSWPAESVVSRAWLPLTLMVMGPATWMGPPHVEAPPVTARATPVKAGVTSRVSW